MKCSKCKNDAIESQTLCVKCKASKERRRQERKSLGICLYCVKSSLPNNSLCEEHLIQRKVRSKELRLNRENNNVCQQCGKNEITEQKICSKCSLNRKKNSEKRLIEGKCLHCNDIRTSDKYCEKHNNYYINFHRKKRQQVIDTFGGKCMCCGEDHIAFLSIDHINNDGSLDRKNGIRSQGLINKIIKEDYPKDKYQLLCHNCNFAKQFWPGGCPHQKNAQDTENQQKSIMHLQRLQKLKTNNEPS